MPKQQFSVYVNLAFSRNF